MASATRGSLRLDRSSEDRLLNSCTYRAGIPPTRDAHPNAKGAEVESPPPRNAASARAMMSPADGRARPQMPAMQCAARAEPLRAFGGLPVLRVDGADRRAGRPDGAFPRCVQGLERAGKPWVCELDLRRREPLGRGSAHRAGRGRGRPYRRAGALA